MIDWLLAEWTQVLGFATGLACVALAARRNIWNYPIGIANNLVFVAVFLGAGLYAAAGLQLVYLAFGIHGWTRWSRGEEKDRLFVGRTPARAVPWLIGAGVLGALVLWAVLTAFTDSQVAIADAATTSASLVAQYMLNRKWVQNWLVWIGVDIAFVALSIATGLWIIAALYVVFISLCLFGWLSWRRIQREGAPTAAQEHGAVARA